MEPVTRSKPGLLLLQGRAHAVCGISSSSAARDHSCVSSCILAMSKKNAALGSTTARERRDSGFIMDQQSSRPHCSQPWSAGHATYRDYDVFDFRMVYAHCNMDSRSHHHNHRASASGIQGCGSPSWLFRKLRSNQRPGQSRMRGDQGPSCTHARDYRKMFLT